MDSGFRVTLQDAFVLHRRPYRESSLLVDIWSRDFGIRRLMAKGALRARGGRSGLLQPFVALSMSWSGRGELATLTAVETRGGPQLRGKALYCGFYLNELLLRLLPAQDPHPALFDYYERSLVELEAGTGLEQTLRYFELNLLDELGYGLELNYDAETGDPLQSDLRYRYCMEKGPVLSMHAADALRGATLLGLRYRRLTDSDALLEAKRLMRAAINHQLGGKPLKSRDLFKFTKTN